MPREQSIVNDSAIRLARIPGVRIWRANSGRAVGWSFIAAALRHLDSGAAGLAAKLLRQCRPVQYGVPGQADLSGIMGDGRRLEVELKTGSGKQRDQQKKYEEMIRSHRGIYILARSADEAERRVTEVLDAEERSANLERELDRDDDIIRWFEHRSSRGDVGLTRELYDQEVLDGRWDPEVGE